MRIHICIYIGISAAPFLTPSPTLYPQAEDTRQQAATDSQSLLLWGSELLMYIYIYNIYIERERE